MWAIALDFSLALLRSMWLVDGDSRPVKKTMTRIAGNMLIFCLAALWGIICVNVKHSDEVLYPIHWDLIDIILSFQISVSAYFAEHILEAIISVLWWLNELCTQTPQTAFDCIVHVWSVDGASNPLNYFVSVGTVQL